MNSTTKYMKVDGKASGSGRYSPPGKQSPKKQVIRKPSPPSRSKPSRQTVPQIAPTPTPIASSTQYSVNKQQKP